MKESKKVEKKRISDAWIIIVIVNRVELKSQNFMAYLWTVHNLVHS